MWLGISSVGIKICVTDTRFVSQDTRFHSGQPNNMCSQTVSNQMNICGVMLSAYLRRTC
ncbi:hypothetical protein KGM_204407 [Danaus plexippus plexippus]|uniref:Uncharacterized protein n=1 Tax=Danaus plexippus plexippus TaxID=278856 RepID=A0A212F3X9_DANPL|nr:hypothetical protein KGM_204407 [Danaus plexippus plexippus]